MAAGAAAGVAAGASAVAAAVAAGAAAAMSLSRSCVNDHRTAERSEAQRTSTRPRLELPSPPSSLPASGPVACATTSFGSTEASWLGLGSGSGLGLELGLRPGPVVTVMPATMAATTPASWALGRCSPKATDMRRIHMGTLDLPMV